MLYSDEFLERLHRGLQDGLEAWGIAADAPLRLLTISENATFLVGEGAERRILRVHRPGYHSREDILGELDWLGALRQDGVIDTPAVIPALDGSLLQDFDDGEARRFAVCFEFVEGQEPDADSDLVHWFGKLGEITARMHGHARGFRLPEGLGRKRWTFETILGPQAHWGDWRRALGLDDAGRAVLERAAAEIEQATAAFGTGPERFGLVHCDMRAANLLVQGERLWVIDFDDCGFGWYGYDFAAAVSFIEEDPILPALREAWVAGYRRVAPMEAATEAALPMFVMLRRMQLTAWIASHAETPTAQAMGPDYTDGTVRLARAWLAGRRA